MPEDHFGRGVAERYDEDSAEMFDPGVVEPAVDFLARLAGPAGTALEFGIGTGRIALALSRRGVRVHGIDLSEAMLEQLRRKPGSDAIGLTRGDFATTAVPGTYAVAYLVFNTIMNLTTQDEQVACFCNVARHLAAGGHFVIEVGVPQLQRLVPGERFDPFAVTPTRLGFDEYDVANQGLISHHYRIEDGRCDARSIPFRYVWPAELDLMARIAGMALVERWADWDRTPFSGGSAKHVSVWRKPPA